MTNEELERLEALAESALEFTPDFRSGSAQTVKQNFMMTFSPTTILSLIQRVKEAERVQRTNYYHHVDRPIAVDPNCISAWLAKNEGSSLGSVAGVISGLIAEARAAGRAEALEEAANTLEKLIDEYGYANMDNKGYSGLGELRDAVETIRALGEKER